jgi:putative protein-disulfide isomerase
MDYNQIIGGDTSQYADRVNIVYYTDPLCCWSWALEPHWKRFVAVSGDSISYSYCMGGMIPDWQNFNDPLNAVSRPIQMGPVWMEAKHLTGTGIDESIWVKDPPSSSYPACIAVKAAGLQSKVAEDVYLKRIRTAVMLECRNISCAEVLSDLARQTSLEFPAVFDFGRFVADIKSEASRQAFRDDLAKTRYHQIGRFPSITMTAPGGKSLIITGYRPYEVLVEALRAISPKSVAA